MFKEFYLMLRELAIGCSPENEDILIEEGFDRRTIKGLIRFTENEPGIQPEVLKRLLDPKFYQFENMLKIAKEGLYDIIPAYFFEDEEYLEKTGIDFLPYGFVAGDKKIKSFHLSEKIKKIETKAFEGCSNLQTIELHEKLTYIGDKAFKGCHELNVTNLPESLMYLGEEAFRDCRGIQEISYPIGLYQIEDGVFKGCTNLESFQAAGLKHARDKCFEECYKLKKVDALFSHVGKECFSDCRSLKKVTLSQCAIGKDAFRNCVSLEQVVYRFGFPGEIAKNAFPGCIRLNKVKIDGYEYQLKEMKGFYEFARAFSSKPEINGEPANKISAMSKIANVVLDIG